VLTSLGLCWPDGHVVVLRCVRCAQLYSNFIPKLTPEGDLPDLSHGGVGKPTASPWELSLPQLHDMVCGLEDFQLLRWKLLKVPVLSTFGRLSVILV
jgi:hypothetical protein